ncbi:helix-turn-helix transcriptional regulator [Spirosoma sp. KCTC 42546]|uniref:helix-turn-helix domain-containing protein n=1 Tax=Spirosoma sp. KCTC 42546 TaxID=2520506 RepID=UPI00115A18ED|nr:helix-turn-helix transcriptional regulator [Spirosoma sp. KCTC 42546]
MSEITEQVGQLIREARKAKGMTQQEMADKLGISKSAYSRYESGSQNITIVTLQKIGEVLGLGLIVRYQ